MEIRKTTTVVAIESNGDAMEIGKTYAFDVEEGNCRIGVFQGLTKRGALAFESIVSGSLVTFNVMPKSVLKIKKVEVSK